MGKNVVVAGGGIAGLETALRLERKGFQVKLVDPGDGLFFYPSGHKIIDGESVEKVTINYSRKFQGRDIKHFQASLENIDKDQKKVLTDSGEFSYDYLVLALGSEANFFGVDPEEAELMRYKEDLLEIYERLENGSEKAFVVGGGATGIEAAASLSERENVETTLIQAEDRLVPEMNEKTSKKAAKILENKDVNLKFSEPVTDIKDNRIETSENSYTSDIIIWAAGIKKRELLDSLDLPQNDRGLLVDQYQRVEGENSIFAVGDNCFYTGKKSRALYALFESKSAAENIRRREKEENLKERTITYDPLLLYMGKHNSILEFKRYSISGLIPSIMEKIGVEKRYMLIRKYLL